MCDHYDRYFPEEKEERDLQDKKRTDAWLKGEKTWIAFEQAKLQQALYNMAHNEWINSHHCNNKDCLICNSLKK